MSGDDMRRMIYLVTCFNC